MAAAIANKIPCELGLCLGRAAVIWRYPWIVIVKELPNPGAETYDDSVMLE
ncbi:hypothetical protein HMPREF0578_1779 [Mobiluncus mulieris 28-1]|nr:hypothetical protein HMPREF0578_1779 [Mobiluncus mulieris 28-1]